MDITRTWAKLDFETMNKNYIALKECADSGMEIKQMVSANAYSFEAMTGGPVQGTCTQYLAVNTLEDGITLRKKGVTFPILILEYPNPDNVTAYVKKLHLNYLKQAVSSFTEAREIANRVIPAYGGVIGVHIKVEIAEKGEGFHYINKESNIDEMIAVKSNLGMYCEGIFTELDNSDPEEEKVKKVKAMHELAHRLEDFTGKAIPMKHVFCTDKKK